MSSLSFTSHTNEAMANFFLLFGVTSYNSIFLILFLGAKLDFIPILGQYFRDGKNRDFTYIWYKEIGAIFISRMIILLIQSFIPTVKTRIMNCLNWIYFKQNCIGSTYRKGVWQYIEAQLGPYFKVETNMFNLANVLLMTFMFGAGIPILFPLALLYVIFNEGNMRY